MSSFMCCKETIWDITSYICKEFPNEVYDILGKKKPNIPDLYKMLVDMNVEALKERYGDSAVPELTGDLEELYCYTDLMGGDFGKALCIQFECYLYQCYEGKIPEGKLYELVSNAHYYLCMSMVNSTINNAEIREYWR